jgi:peptidoglycan/LPS O-acetylase OafA/YrhL
MKRIQYLDGHRGIAILLVVFYHLFSRWNEILPYGDSFSNIVFEQGFLGVQLFFLISGFVILMTLDRENSLPSFMYKRWLRLFPAMLICTAFILFTSDIFNSRPAGEVNLLDVAPGLLFIEPNWLEKLIGVPFSSLEGAFWSLYVEFKFYLIAAFLYFVVKDKKLTFLLFGLFLLSIISQFLNQFYDSKIIYVVYALSTHLSLSFFGWFAAGTAFYLFYKGQDYKWLFCGFLMAVVSSILLYKDNYQTMISAVAISIFFTLSFVSVLIQRLLQNRLLIFIGFVSYPLYLLHENMMISMSIDMSENFQRLPMLIPPLIAIAVVIAISYFISKYLEVPAKNYCKFACEKLMKLLIQVKKRYSTN